MTDMTKAELVRENVRLRREWLEAKHNPCQLSEDSDGNWETACGEILIFTEAGPAENGYKYCPYCGGLVTVKRYELRSEEKKFVKIGY